MAIQLNHTIVNVRDKRASAGFLAELFGLPAPKPFAGDFLTVALANGYWADPGKRQKGEINRHDGGRGVYFEEPSKHFLEIIIRPYGG